MPVKFPGSRRIGRVKFTKADGSKVELGRIDLVQPDGSRKTVFRKGGRRQLATPTRLSADFDSASGGWVVRWAAVTEDTDGRPVRSPVTYDYHDNGGNDLDLADVMTSPLTFGGREQVTASVVAKADGYDDSTAAAIQFTAGTPPRWQNPLYEGSVASNSAALSVRLTGLACFDSEPTSLQYRFTGSGTWTERATPVADRANLVATLARPSGGWGQQGTVYSATLEATNRFGLRASTLVRVTVGPPVVELPCSETLYTLVIGSISQRVTSARALRIELAPLFEYSGGGSLTYSDRVATGSANTGRTISDGYLIVSALADGETTGVIRASDGRCTAVVRYSFDSAGTGTANNPPTVVVSTPDQTVAGLSRTTVNYKATDSDGRVVQASPRIVDSSLASIEQAQFDPETGEGSFIVVAPPATFQQQRVTACVTATDDDGDQNTDSAESCVVFTVPPLDRFLEVGIKTVGRAVKPGEEVDLDAFVHVDQNRSIASTRWTVEEGGGTFEYANSLDTKWAAPTEPPTERTTHRLRQTATTSDDEVDFAEVSFWVDPPPNQPPQAEFITQPRNVDGRTKVRIELRFRDPDSVLQPVPRVTFSGDQPNDPAGTLGDVSDSELADDGWYYAHFEWTSPARLDQANAITFLLDAQETATTEQLRGPSPPAELVMTVPGRGNSPPTVEILTRDRAVTDRTPVPVDFSASDDESILNNDSLSIGTIYTEPPNMPTGAVTSPPRFDAQLGENRGRFTFTPPVIGTDRYAIVVPLIVTDDGRLPDGSIPDPADPLSSEDSIRFMVGRGERDFEFEWLTEGRKLSSDDLAGTVPIRFRFRDPENPASRPALSITALSSIATPLNSYRGTWDIHVDDAQTDGWWTGSANWKPPTRQEDTNVVTFTGRAGSGDRRSDPESVPFEITGTGEPPQVDILTGPRTVQEDSTHALNAVVTKDGEMVMNDDPLTTEDESKGVRFMWTALASDGGDAGSFDDPELLNPTWTAPACRDNENVDITLALAAVDLANQTGTDSVVFKLDECGGGGAPTISLRAARTSVTTRDPVTIHVTANDTDDEASGDPPTFETDATEGDAGNVTPRQWGSSSFPFTPPARMQADRDVTVSATVIDSDSNPQSDEVEIIVEGINATIDGDETIDMCEVEEETYVATLNAPTGTQASRVTPPTLSGEGLVLGTISGTGPEYRIGIRNNGADGGPDGSLTVEFTVGEAEEVVPKVVTINRCPLALTEISQEKQDDGRIKLSATASGGNGAYQFEFDFPDSMVDSGPTDTGGAWEAYLTSTASGEATLTVRAGNESVVRSISVDLGDLSVLRQPNPVIVRGEPVEAKVIARGDGGVYQWGQVTKSDDGIVVEGDGGDGDTFTMQISWPGAENGDEGTVSVPVSGANQSTTAVFTVRRVAMTVTIDKRQLDLTIEEHDEFQVRVENGFEAPDLIAEFGGDFIGLEGPEIIGGFGRQLRIYRVRVTVIGIGEGGQVDVTVTDGDTIFQDTVSITRALPTVLCPASAIKAPGKRFIRRVVRLTIERMLRAARLLTVQIEPFFFRITVTNLNKALRNQVAVNLNDLLNLTGFSLPLWVVEDTGTGVNIDFAGVSSSIGVRHLPGLADRFRGSKIVQFQALISQLSVMVSLRSGEILGECEVEITLPLGFEFTLRTPRFTSVSIRQSISSFDENTYDATATVVGIFDRARVDLGGITGRNFRFSAIEDIGGGGEASIWRQEFSFHVEVPDNNTEATVVFVPIGTGDRAEGAGTPESYLWRLPGKG